MTAASPSSAPRYLHPTGAIPTRGDPGENIIPKVSTRVVVVWDTGWGLGLALSGPPRARSSLLASISDWGGKYGAVARAGAESEAVLFHHPNLFVCSAKRPVSHPKTEKKNPNTKQNQTQPRLLRASPAPKLPARRGLPLGRG